MVRTCYILAVAAWIATAGITVFCVADLFLPHSSAQSMSSCSAIERFKASIKDRAKSNEGGRAFPLVQQAEVLAAFLNPPVRPKSVTAMVQNAKQPLAPAAPKITIAEPSTPFQLHGISYRPSRPHDSMALVWLPDTGHQWVKEGTQLGHVTIVGIQSDSILCLAGDQRRRMALDTSQIATTLAHDRQEKNPPQRLDNPRHETPRPPPALGIRQMPIERIAAKLGIHPNDLDNREP